MTKNLHISDDLTLPIEVVTMATGILGIRGSGKTNTAGVWAEELLKRGQQVIVIDPQNVWWGLKSSADGKHPGFPVIVFGGNHADVPLGGTEGKQIADFAVERRVPCIFSLRHLTLAAQRRFVTDFSQQLFFRKGEEQYQDPVLVFIDEAHKFVPQKVGPDMTHMVHAIQTLVAEGRASGIGVALIDQRAATVNKDVLTQVELMVVHRTVGPQDKKALDDWIKDNADVERRAEFMKSLAGLPLGRAWFWSVGWLDVFHQVQVRMRETFDSSRTPKPGEKRVTPRTLAEVNLDELREQLASTIEEAMANDPRELKKQVAALQRELQQAQSVQSRAKTTVEQVEVPVITDEQLQRFERCVADLRDLEVYVDNMREALKGAEDLRTFMLEGVRRLKAAKELPTARTETLPGGRTATSVPRSLNPPPRTSQNERTHIRAAATDLTISKTQQRILDALAWYESIGISEPSNLQIGAIALIDATGGHFSNTVGPLSSAGLLQRGGGTMRLTNEGRALASIPDRVATLNDYHDVLRRRILKVRHASPRTVDILNAVIARGGAEMTAEEIGREVGIDHMGGHFSNTIGPLGTLGLIERNRGVVRPTEILFPVGLS